MVPTFDFGGPRVFPVSGSFKVFRLKTGVYTDVVIHCSDPMLRTATLKLRNPKASNPKTVRLMI